MIYAINETGQLILTILHDNNDVNYCLVNGEIVICDEVSGEVEAV